MVNSSCVNERVAGVRVIGIRAVSHRQHPHVVNAVNLDHPRTPGGCTSVAVRLRGSRASCQGSGCEVHVGAIRNITARAGVETEWPRLSCRACTVRDQRIAVHGWLHVVTG